MSKVLLVAGGVLNTVFFIFQLLLGYQINQVTEVPAPYRALMEALNLGGVLFLFFFAYASFFYEKELLQTGVGRAVLALAAVLYLSRAAEEFFLFKFTPAIFGSCLFAGAIYLALFVMALKKTRSTAPDGKIERTPGEDSAKLRRVA